MSEGKIHKVVNKMISSLLKEDITQDLQSDEQAKMRVANTDPELRSYVSESRLLQDRNLSSDLIYQSLKVA